MRQPTTVPKPGSGQYGRPRASFLPMRVRMGWGGGGAGGAGFRDTRKVHEPLPRRLTQSVPISDTLA
jgi:hypothetical protein